MLNVITKLELSVVLEKIKSNLGNYIWKINDLQLVREQFQLLPHVVVNIEVIIHK